MTGRRRQTVIVNDRMQRGYQYERIAPLGRNFLSEFHPELTPKEMPELGVFCGKYMTDTRTEFPAQDPALFQFPPGISGGSRVTGVARRSSQIRMASPNHNLAKLSPSLGFSPVSVIVLQ